MPINTRDILIKGFALIGIAVSTVAIFMLITTSFQSRVAWGCALVAVVYGISYTLVLEVINDST
jgi:uncharacterized protein YqhQ